VGLQDLNELQVACLMRVLSKQEYDDAIKYSELEQLMQNFGVNSEEGENDFTDQIDMDEEDANNRDQEEDSPKEGEDQFS